MSRYHKSRPPYSVPTWVLGKNPFVTIDGYKYAIESDKPTLDDWDIMEVYTGTTNSDEWRDIAYTDCLRENPVDFEWISYTKVGEYTMLHIPAGRTDKIYSTGTIGGNFTPGKTYGIGFNYKLIVGDEVYVDFYAGNSPRLSKRFILRG